MHDVQLVITGSVCVAQVTAAGRSGRSGAPVRRRAAAPHRSSAVALAPTLSQRTAVGAVSARIQVSSNPEVVSYVLVHVSYVNSMDASMQF